MPAPQSHARDALVRRGGQGDAGLTVPFEHFGDPLLEMSGSRRHAGFFEHRFHRSLILSGDEAREALQGQITQDLMPLRPGTGAYACHLDRKGGLVTDLVILLESEERLRLLLPSDNQDVLAAKLRPVAMLADCTLEAPADEPARFLLAGPAAFRRISALCGETIKLLPYAHRQAEIGSISLGLIGWPETGDEGVLMEVAPADAERLIDRVLEDDEVQLAGDTAWNILRLEAGTPVWGHELGPGRLPPEAGLDHAISYTKGCYVGQETIARIRTYGRVNRSLVGLSINGEGRAGAELLVGDKVVGTITSGIEKSSLGGPRGLGYVRRAHLADGTELQIRSADGQGLGTARVGPRSAHPPRYAALPVSPGP